jgi:hypothetical protein
MRKLVCVAIVSLLMASAAEAQIHGDRPDQEGVGGTALNPLRAGRFELTPILSTQFYGGGLAINVGASFGYMISRSHQLGGTFIYGNTVRESQTVRPRNNAVQKLIENGTGPTAEQVLAGMSNLSNVGYPSRRGWGASLTGFYRFNVPVEHRKVRPYLSIFGGRDFHNGFDYSEVGGALGARRAISPRVALTAQYGYSLLFSNGQTYRRNGVSFGLSVFVGR